MSKLKINRRSMLGGIGGVALALPFLEAMIDSTPAAAAELPTRYLVAFAGSSLGRKVKYSDPDSQDLFVPNKFGADYDLPFALEPLEPVKDRVSVVSNLNIPWGPNGSVPAGGRVKSWHHATLGPIVSGVRSVNDSGESRGVTSDQIVAAQLGASTPFDSLALRVQAATYRGSNGLGGDKGRMSMRAKGNGLQAIDPIVSPALLFSSLFSNVAPTDPAELASYERTLSRRTSALDLVNVQANRLMSRLGAADRARLESHLDAVRDLETRLKSDFGDGCLLPTDPGTDPPIGGANEGNNFNVNKGYSNEERRAELMTEMIALAFACDLTRSVSLMYTMSQCFMSMYEIAGRRDDLHAMGHGSKNNLDAMSDGVAWHVKHFAALVGRLRDIQEVDGNSLLDHSALTLTFEGGHGFDPATGEKGKPHSSERMGCLVAGGAGGLVQGVHIDGQGKHPANVLVSAMNAVGVDAGLGEVSGTLPGLLT